MGFFEWLVCTLAKKVIYDIDDLVYLADSKSNVNKIIAGLKGKNKPVFLMKQADHVITCTPYLDTFVRKYNQQTTDISSTIDTEKYRPKTDYSIQGRKIIFGWSGSHSTSKYLYLLEPVFRQLQKEGIVFQLLVMGDAGFHIEGIETEALPWKESYETTVIGRFDIGLYPLPDEQWAATPLNLPVGGGLADQARAVLAALAAGQLPVNQSASILQGLGNLAKLVELDELTRRIEALEGKQA